MTKGSRGRANQKNTSRICSLFEIKQGRHPLPRQIDGKRKGNTTTYYNYNINHVFLQRKMISRKVEQEQREHGAAKRKAPEPENSENPESSENPTKPAKKTGSALGRFTKNRKK